MPYRIREFREKQNLTQVELCKRAEISRQKLIELESGKESNTTILTLKKNCRCIELQSNGFILP